MVLEGEWKNYLATRWVLHEKGYNVHYFELGGSNAIAVIETTNDVPLILATVAGSVVKVKQFIENYGVQK